MPAGLEIAAVPPREDPADAWIGAGASLDDVARGRPGRHRQPAPPRPAARRPPRPAGGGAARQRRHPPAQARRGRARRDRPRRRRPAPARPRVARSASRSRSRRWSRRPGQGALALQVRAGDEETTEAVGGDLRPRRRPRADRRAGRGAPARRQLHDPGRRPRPGRGRAASRSSAFVGLPDGSEWLRDRIEADAAEPAAAGVRLAERLLSAGARDLLDRAEAMA